MTAPALELLFRWALQAEMIGLYGPPGIALVNLLGGSEPRQVVMVVAIAAAGALAIERLAPGAPAGDRAALGTPVLE